MERRPAETPEFSRPVDIGRLGRDEVVHGIAAGETERTALARRFDLLTLDRLEAAVRLHRVPGGLVRLTADLSADVVQSCVVTLEPVPSQVTERFSVLYGGADTAAEVVLDGEAEAVEPLEGEILDIGEAVAQQLSLALEPYPRAPEVATEAPAAAAPEPSPADSPFAALAAWGKKS